MDDPHEAEYGLQQWSAELDELTRQLSEREDGIINAHSELERLGQSLKSQEDVDRYNTMVEAYNEGLNQYQELYSDYERLYGRYGEGVVKYRELLGSGAERAVSYRDEAERLIERNEELDVQMASQRTNAATAATAAEREAALEAYGKLEAEYDKNRSEIARLNNEASEAQWEYYSSLRLNDDFDALSAPMGSQRVAQGRAGESPYYSGGTVYDYINAIGNARQMRGYDAEGNEMQALGTMTEDEVRIYNYLYATQGREAAKQFLSDIRESLNQRLGTQRYEDMSGIGRALYWIPAGLDQFSSGIQQLFTGNAVPTSPTQYTSSLIQQAASERKHAI